MNREKSDATSAAAYRFPGFRAVVVTLAIAATTLGCTWSLLTEHSVRFNAFRSGRGFYRLPPLPIMYDRESGKEITIESQNDFYDYDGPFVFREYAAESEETPKAPGDGTWRDLQTSIDAVDLKKARTLLEKYLDETESEISWEGVRDTRNAAYDMLDAMTALKKGSKPEAVKIYLDARNAFGFQIAAPETEELIERAAADENLEDNADYLRAALLVRKELTQDALEAFAKLIAAYPDSEKSEAASYMWSKLTMESSYSFGHDGCGILRKDDRGEEVNPSAIEPTEKCQDENWHRAVNAFQRLMKKYPDGRYFSDARGWLAFLYKRGGERAKSLAEYYRMLGHPTRRAVRLEAKKSLQIIGHEYDDATLDEVEKLIADDVNTAMAYAYHRIYNHAVDLTYARVEPWCCYGENPWGERRKEEKRVTDARTAGSHELGRIVSFATAVMKRYPNAPAGGGFVIRVAEANLELQNYGDARAFAVKALAMGVQDDLRAEALWTKGSAEHEMDNLREARATFTALITEFPSNKLTEGARRLLAMTAEDQGDLESALEHYLALKYHYDVAYFVDVLMPTDRLATFVEQRPNIPERDRLLYAVGVRHMRDGHWNLARQTLEKVKTDSGINENKMSMAEEDSKSRFAKEPSWEHDKPLVVKTSWVMQDLKTIDVLEHLEQATYNSPGDESRAEAMYQLASYLFGADDLLFYNPAAWKGTRADLLNELQSGDSVRSPNESQIIFEHSQSHDTIARAIPIYLDIASRFPNTRAAKDALY
nr:outer membrane protein assembly factor BamD [Blastocatellia bacterium]